MRGRLLLLLGGLLSGFVLLEVVLRVFPVPAVEIHRRAPADTSGFFDYDPELGWRGRAGAHGVLSGWEFTSDIRLNARGFRDTEVAVAKPPGVFRVVLLGDSITWGHGVEQSQRYGDILTEDLHLQGRAVQVVNLAVSGYGTDQELLLWEREGRSYCADLVLLGLYENDVRENALAFQGRYPKPYFRLTPDGALTLTHVPVPRVSDWEPGGLDHVRPRDWIRGHVRVWAALAMVRQAFRGSATAAPPPPSPAGLDLTAALIRRLAARVTGDGSAFAIVILPDLFYSGSTKAAAARAAVGATLDLSATFRRAAPDGAALFYRLDGAHWTPRAHALAADAIASWMRAAHIVSPAPRPCPEVS